MSRDISHYVALAKGLSAFFNLVHTESFLRDSEKNLEIGKILVSIGEKIEVVSTYYSALVQYD